MNRPALSPSGSRIAEFRRGWPLLLASVLGSAMIGVPLYATGVLMPIWEDCYGWRRGEVALALSLFNVALVLLVPVVGRIAARSGVRRPALWSLALLVPAFVLIARSGPALWTLYLGYTLFAAVGVGSTFVTFTRSVTEYFRNARGMAIGIVCSSTTLCMIVTPALTQMILSRGHEWPMVWLAFAALTTLLWPVVYLGLKEVPIAADAVPDPARPGTAPADITRLPPVFWLMGLVFFLVSFAATGPMLQIVPIARSYGFGQDAAIGAATALALGVGLSRLFSGLLLDRLFAPVVLRTVVLAGLAGCLLILGLGSAGILVGAFLIGTAVGAEGDILAYLTSRYFSLADYSRLYGQLYSAMLCGVIVSPVATGFAYDLSKRYDITLAITIACFAVAAILIGRLPRYRDRQPDGFI